MIKCADIAVTFGEIPDEITLAINISNCPCHCKGCHSPYLAEDVGIELGWYDCIARTGKSISLYKLILENRGITCVAFMGGDNDARYLNELARRIKEGYHGDIQGIKVAWYSGRQELNSAIDIGNFDYIKLGPYIEELGPLNVETTNQRMYRVLHEVDQDTVSHKMEDITSKFWRKIPDSK